MPGPIRPEDVPRQKAAQIPEKVFEVFNRLIAREWDGSSATIRQDEVVELLVSEGLNRARIVLRGHVQVFEEARQLAA